MATVKKPLSAYGIDLTAPASPSLVPAKTGGKFMQGPGSTGGGSIASSLQSFQDQANAANDLRYTQGLGVLTQGNQFTNDTIEKAIAGSASIGQGAKRRIADALVHDQGKTEQNAISRGLGNTTIRNSMLDQDKRRANDANADVDEQVAGRQSNLRLTQAQNFTNGANSIASFIASRQDSQPDPALFAQLAAQAAAAPSGQRSVATTVSPEFRASMGSTMGTGGGPTNASETIRLAEINAQKAAQPTYFGPSQQALQEAEAAGIAQSNPMYHKTLQDLAAREARFSPGMEAAGSGPGGVGPVKPGYARGTISIKKSNPFG